MTKDAIKAKKQIAKYKARLKKQAVCENFGQGLVRQLEDDFSEYRYGVNDVWSLIRAFDEWCMTYTPTNHGVTNPHAQPPALTWEDHVYPSEARDRGWDDSRNEPLHGFTPNPFTKAELLQAYDEGFADYRRNDDATDPVMPWEVLRPITNPDDPEEVLGLEPDDDWL